MNEELPPIGDFRPAAGTTLPTVAGPGFSDEPAYSDDTEKLLVRKEHLLRLWEMNRIAIHYPEYRGKLRRIDNESRDLEDCTGTVKSAVRCLKELGDRGGYVWTQSLVSDNIKIGIVRSGTDIELCEAEWQVPDGHEQRRTGDRAVLKTLLLRDKLEDVHPGQAIGLRAGRLQQGTFVR